MRATALSRNLHLSKDLPHRPSSSHYPKNVANLPQPHGLHDLVAQTYALLAIFSSRVPPRLVCAQRNEGFD